MGDPDAAARRAQLLCRARGDTITGLRETLRMVTTVMALREHCPFARPMGDTGRPIDAADPYLPRPRIPAQRRPPAAERRLRRCD